MRSRRNPLRSTPLGTAEERIIWLYVYQVHKLVTASPAVKSTYSLPAVGHRVPGSEPLTSALECETRSETSQAGNTYIE